MNGHPERHTSADPRARYSVLSELMLPDGAHLRAEDWTIFCLNQRIPELDSDNDADESDAEDCREKPLLYVLNLVRTKHDATARRYDVSRQNEDACGLTVGCGYHKEEHM